MLPKLHTRALPLLGWRRFKRLISHHYGVDLVFRPTLEVDTRLFLALLLGGDFFTGAVLAAALTKLVLRFSDLSPDKKKANALRAEAMLIMTSTIRVGQSKFSSTAIDEDSNERILNCIQTLSDLEVMPVVHSIFLSDTKAAYSNMVAAQEVYISCGNSFSD
jgi:vesicle coat complex subunit